MRGTGSKVLRGTGLWWQSLLAGHFEVAERVMNAPARRSAHVTAAELPGRSSLAFRTVRILDGTDASLGSIFISGVVLQQEECCTPEQYHYGA